MLDFTFIDNDNLSPFEEDFYRDIIKIVIKYLDLGGLSIGLSLQIESVNGMRKLNHQYRNKDEPTDVLSFPIYDELVDSNFKNRGTIEIGDLYICPEVAITKAEQNNKTLEQEYYFLVVHGFLHLLGYDHERSADEERLMFEIQDKIIEIIQNNN